MVLSTASLCLSVGLNLGDGGIAYQIDGAKSVGTGYFTSDEEIVLPIGLCADSQISCHGGEGIRRHLCGFVEANAIDI